MNNDIVLCYLNRKKQNIINYTEVLLRHVLKKKAKLTKTISKIVDIYINNFYLAETIDYEELEEFIKVDKNQDPNLKAVLLSSILCYKNNNLEEKISSDTKKIIFISNVISMAIAIEQNVNTVKYPEINPIIVMDKVLKEYKNRLFESTKDSLTSARDELELLIKKDISVEKKFWKLLENSTFNLTFSTTTNKNYFLVDCDYEMKMLNKYSLKDINYIEMNKGINDKINIIYIESLLILALKNFIKGHTDDKFFIKLPIEFYTKKKNINVLTDIFSNPCLMEKIVFMFDFDEFNKYRADISDFKNFGYKLSFDKVGTNETKNRNMFSDIKIVFIDKQFLIANEKYTELWKDKKVEFIENELHPKNIEIEKIINRK